MTESADIQVVSPAASSSPYPPTIYLFQPRSPRGWEWMREHAEDFTPWRGDFALTLSWGGALVVEHRYAGTLVEAAQADGLEVI